MALPHDFKPGTTMGIGTGTWYVLTPAGGNHVIKTSKYLPVTDSIAFSQQHVWNESDNLGKNILSSIENLPGQILSGASRRTSKLGKYSGVANGAAQLVSRNLQHHLGGGPSASACAVYVDSSPPTINVRTKLFSPDGSGSIIGLLEEFRSDFTGGTVGAPSASAFSSAGAAAQSAIAGFNSLVATAGVRGGIISHPGWWTIEIVSFAGGSNSVLMTMKDMIAKSMDVTMYSPFIGQDPSLIELNIGFSHGFRGLRESMSFGGSAGSSQSAGEAGNRSRPQSTPRSNSRPRPATNTSRGTSTSGESDPRANRINLPAGLNNIR